MTKTAVALRHVHFEDLGSFEAVLASSGYKVHYYDIGVHPLWTLDPLGFDLLVVLGGPIGVYDQERYPFLVEELQLVSQRAAARRPTLGICLGAQIIAAALGANVYPSGIREIGFAPVELSDAGQDGPLRHLDGVPVLHWHGDTFDLPPGAALLASTARCKHQAFSVDANILGLQFHPEVPTGTMERWLVGHAVELAISGIDPRLLRAEAESSGAALRDAARALLTDWLKALRA